MAHVSKRRKAFVAKVDRSKVYPAMEALKLVKDTATAKFDEAVDVAVNLGIDAKKCEQTVRGSVVLPAGTGKQVRVAVFAAGDQAQAGQAACNARSGAAGAPPSGGATTWRRWSMRGTRRSPPRPRGFF